jgi:hypothetical protein
LNPPEADKPGVPPRHDELDHFLCDLPFPQEHPQHFVLKGIHGMGTEQKTE